MLKLYIIALALFSLATSVLDYRAIILYLGPQKKTIVVLGLCFVLMDLFFYLIENACKRVWSMNKNKNKLIIHFNHTGSLPKNLNVLSK